MIAYVSAAIGKQAVQLATVAPAQPVGRGKKAAPDAAISSRTDRQVRAILRAPLEAEPVYAEAAAQKQKADGAKGGRPSKTLGRKPTQGFRDESARALAQAAKETGASLDSAKVAKATGRGATDGEHDAT